MSGEAALQRAAALFNAGQLDAAREAAQSLVAANPKNFLALHLLGAIAIRANQPEVALARENEALALHPDDAEALCNRGIALRTLDRIDEALADYDRVLAKRPAFAPALTLKGVALAARNRHAEAIACYAKAIDADPRHAPAYFNRSLSELVLGDFAKGWPDFEWRWGGSDTQLRRREFREPPWRGEDPRGKTILVHAEQGLGDAIQMSRYVPMLAERGAKVVLETQKPLVELFAQLPAQVVALGDALPRFDAQVATMSLPFAFATRLETIPSRSAYLQVSPQHRARWNDRLGPRKKPRVGLAWSGSTTLRNDRNRSIPLAALAPLREGPWSLVSLQKELRDSDRDALNTGEPIAWHGDAIDDFCDTAALIDAMDVVVTVDTAIAHLAGALGKPVWILLPFSPDWRWLLEREDSPWYPTARLFRQARPGDWAPVIARVRAALTARS